MRSKKVITQVFGLFCRYACAILVAYLVSALIILIGAKAINKGVIEFLSGALNHPMHPIACFGIAYAAAFVGVLSGGLCLPGRSRGLASVTLVVMGLAYYMTYWYVYWRHEAPGRHGNGPMVVPLAAGGLCAWFLTVWISRRRLKAANFRRSEPSTYPDSP
jgi:hypothetical protein